MYKISEDTEDLLLENTNSERGPGVFSVPLGKFLVSGPDSFQLQCVLDLKEYFFKYFTS